LDAQKWYSITQKEILSAGGFGILYHFQGSYTAALMEVYPELMLKKENFFRFQAPEQRRKFLDEFAKSKHFDPLDAEKWYSITKEDIIRAGGRGILNYYNELHMEALAKLYPELGLKLENFLHYQGWKLAEQRRKFFDELAKSKLFDPLDATKWYSVTRKDVTTTKGGNSILHYYKGSFITALIKLYPELILERKKFFLCKRKWENRRQRKLRTHEIVI